MDETRTESRLPGWFWIVSIWGGVALFDATQTVVVMRAEGMHHNWNELFITVLLSWLPWALATPFILRIAQKAPLSDTRVSHWMVHLATCAGIGLASSAWLAWLENLLNPWAKVPPPTAFLHLWLFKFYNGLLLFFMLYGFVLIVSYVLRSRERLAQQQTETARLNEQLSKSQLDALRRQIEPHFLFNTLNAIAGLVREKRNDAAVSMIAGLSDFLRRTLEEAGRQQVPLGEEMVFLQKYLEIQKLRFGARLQLKIEIPRELLCAQVPSLILQLIVENAIKHGIAKLAQGGAIRIAAYRLNGSLQLIVYNDGPSLPSNWEQTNSGIGMANMRTRLRSLYGDAFELSMQNQSPSGVAVTVSVPWMENQSRERG